MHFEYVQILELNQDDSIKAPTPVKVGQFKELSLQDWNCCKLSTAKISINLSIGSQKPAELNTNVAHRGRDTKAQTQTSQSMRITVAGKHCWSQQRLILSCIHFAGVYLIAESKGGFSLEILSRASLIQNLLFNRVPAPAPSVASSASHQAQTRESTTTYRTNYK